MIPNRWPLHPKPVLGESLSSWLERIAGGYGLKLWQLLEYDLGCPELFPFLLDKEPPLELIQLIAMRTGTSVDTVRSKTFASLVPFLFDSLSPEREYFEHYVEEQSVLLPPSVRPLRSLTRWVPWFPKKPEGLKACRDCLISYPEAALLLHWQLSLMTCCPEHGLVLEPVFVLPGTALRWTNDASEEAPNALRSLDRRSLDALTTGFVELPRRRIHAGVWFRLLRTILDEVNTPIKDVPRQQTLLKKVWAATGLRPRAGEIKWKPFEELTAERRSAMFAAAAVAIEMIEAGVISPAGDDADLFCAPPAMHSEGIPEFSHDLVSPSHSSGNWPNIQAAMEEAIQAARNDPEEAQQLRLFMLFGRRDQKSIRDVDKVLQDLGIIVTEPLPDPLQYLELVTG